MFTVSSFINKLIHKVEISERLGLDSLKNLTPPFLANPNPGDMLDTEMGLVIIQKGDGNCLFRSVATALSFHEDELRENGKWDLEAMDQEEMHKTLRQRSAEWCRSNIEDETLRSYLISTIQDCNDREVEKENENVATLSLLIEMHLVKYSEKINHAISQVEYYSRLSDSSDKNQEKNVKSLLNFWLTTLHRFQKAYGDLVDQKAKFLEFSSLSQSIATPDDYINAVSKNGFFAGLSDIYALAQMYNVDIVILYASDDHKRVSEKNNLTILGGIEGIRRPVIHLEYINGNHYNTILPTTAF